MVQISALGNISEKKAKDFVAEAVQSGAYFGHCEASVKEVLEHLGFPVPSDEKLVTVRVRVSDTAGADLTGMWQWSINHDSALVEDWEVLKVEDGD